MTLVAWRGEGNRSRGGAEGLQVSPRPFVIIHTPILGNLLRFFVFCFILVLLQCIYFNWHYERNTSVLSPS